MAFQVPAHGQPNWLEMDRDIDRGIDASRIAPVEQVTASLIASPFGGVYVVNTAGGSITITLPRAIDCKGRMYQFKKTAAANTMTLQADGSETIDGAATLASTVQYISFTLVSDGDNWHVV